MGFTDRKQFIEREILATLPSWPEDYDLEAICDEVSEYDEREGYVWRKEFRGEDGHDVSLYWDIVAEYDANQCWERP